MSIDLSAAEAFMTTHARVLDRHRFAFATGTGGADAVLAALAAYRNPDGGYGWGLEPDLRSPESQPAGALHALETFAEVGARNSGELAGWLDSVSLPDGGLPFCLPVGEPAGSAPWWLAARPGVSSLHITAAVVAAAHRVAERDQRLREHPWLARATEYCWRGVLGMGRPGFALELRYLLWFLDAVVGRLDGADRELARLAAWLPEDGVLAVQGGVAGEALRPLDIAPEPGRPLRRLVAEAAIRDDLTRLAGLRCPDGGWPVEHAAQTEASALEWRGHYTVRAVRLLA